MTSGGFDAMSMMDLYRMECESQVTAMNKAAVALDSALDTRQLLESLMRSAHSLKGAARMVGLQPGVRIAHRLEDFISELKSLEKISRDEIDLLVGGIDLLALTGKLPEDVVGKWDELHGEDEKHILEMLGRKDKPAPRPKTSKELKVEPDPGPVKAEEPPSRPVKKEEATSRPAERTQLLHLSASSLDRLTGATGEALAISRRLGRTISESSGLRRSLEALHRRISTEIKLNDGDQIDSSLRHLEENLGSFFGQIERLENDLSRLLNQSYQDAQACRMLPFGEIQKRMPRLVHDLTRQLGKEVRLVMEGERCLVDREVLEKLDAPLGHLVRNAIDHGIESPEERRKKGKSTTGVLGISAFHRGGMMVIRVWDDGRGIDYTRIRNAVRDRGLVRADLVDSLSQQELAEFLFLPGFTLAEKVTNVSGRGAGLDAVMIAVREIEGRIRTTSETGKGVTFELVLPISLSVISVLLFRCGGNLYGLPLSRTAGVEMLSSDRIQSTGGREHVALGDRRVSLVALSQILELPRGHMAETVPVILVGDGDATFGLAAEKMEGIAACAMRPLDPRLGKVADVACVGVLDDGRVAVILDQEDLIRSMHRVVHSGSVESVSGGDGEGDAQKRRKKRVLVVDDSLTVRELERKMLTGRGYFVEVAVDGMEAWNALRSRDFDLLVTDIDMPRLDGFGLVDRVRQDARLKRLPTMIVSYKDREEDRMRGLEVGADYYLTKGSFHDEKLIEAVRDLIGEAFG